MLDSHCHLTDRRLRPQLDGVLHRAAAAGVSAMITIGTDIDDDREAVALCAGRANLRAAVGIHPHHASEQAIANLGELERIQADPAVVALGEMGLDYHYDFAPRPIQRTLFEQQLALANRLARPVVIHCREAMDDCMAIMRRHRPIGAVFHCFTGSADEANRILDEGFSIGLTGVVTFKRSEDLRDLARRMPLDRLLIETDAPYLAPEPVRRVKANEPALLVHTARLVANLRGMDVAELARLTAANARRLFGWA